MPEQDALQKAVESNAPADEIKTKMAKYREAMKAKEAKLVKAQDELKQVLSVKQEATAVLMGLLK
jgi:5'-deoxynucleotidase YfbR-like HD superfamily hydrolase